MKVLVCGSRTWDDTFMVNAVLDGIDAEAGENDRLTIIHGAARGADSLAERWARQSGAIIWAFPADWNRYGKRAGYVRNQRMLDEGKPDLVVAFRSPGRSNGTDMMMDLAARAKVPTYVVSPVWPSETQDAWNAYVSGTPLNGSPRNVRGEAIWPECES